MVSITMRKSPILLQKYSFEVRLAETEEEIRQAQNLRHRCFFPHADPSGVDADKFDEFSDHLVCLEQETNRMVGTYRLMRQRHAEEAGTFYSTSEFDLSFLGDLKGNTLELGRSCVDEAYRKSGVATLLWLGCGGYVAAYDIENLFGCASFPGIDPKPFAHALSYLHNELAPPASIKIPALTKIRISTDLLPLEAIDKKRALEQMPPLIKGYSKMGGWFGQEIAVDLDFNCMDVLLCVSGATAPARYHKRFKRPDFVVAQPEDL